MTIDLSNVTDNTRTWARGPAVVPLQRLLQVRADGLGGPATRRTLHDFQTVHGLKPDAVFGEATAAMMLAGKR